MAMAGMTISNTRSLLLVTWIFFFFAFQYYAFSEASLTSLRSTLTKLQTLLVHQPRQKGFAKNLFGPFFGPICFQKDTILFCAEN